MTPLDRAFFRKDALDLARALVGTFLVHDDKVARIVETEAYRGPRDLACHARAGLTKRTRALFGPPGHAYVFLIYGVHDCFNVVANEEGRGHAVLVRGVEPIANIEGRTAGPGLVTRALGITRAHDGVDLTRGTLFIAARSKRPRRLGVSARVGVQYAKQWADKPYRFFEAGNVHVSRATRAQLGSGTSR